MKQIRRWHVSNFWDTSRINLAVKTKNWTNPVSLYEILDISTMISLRIQLRVSITSNSALRISCSIMRFCMTPKLWWIVSLNYRKDGLIDLEQGGVYGGYLDARHEHNYFPFILIYLLDNLCILVLCVCLCNCDGNRVLLSQNLSGIDINGKWPCDFASFFRTQPSELRWTSYTCLTHQITSKQVSKRGVNQSGSTLWPSNHGHTP